MKHHHHNHSPPFPPVAPPSSSSRQVLEQLFSRLDVDGDGRISFEEFVHMFQNGGPSGNTSLVLDDSLPPVSVEMFVY